MKMSNYCKGHLLAKTIMWNRQQAPGPCGLSTATVIVRSIVPLCTPVAPLMVYCSPIVLQWPFFILHLSMCIHLLPINVSLFTFLLYSTVPLNMSLFPFVFNCSLRELSSLFLCSKILIQKLDISMNTYVFHYYPVPPKVPFPLCMLLLHLEIPWLLFNISLFLLVCCGIHPFVFLCSP